MIVASPKTAPKKPWYLPRSRGGTRSPTTASEITISPPPPSPCRARNAISSVMFCASPHSADPIRKITIAICRTRLRPYRSPSFPYSGAAIVEESR